MIEIRRYVTKAGKDVFGEWLRSLRDQSAVARIHVRLDRMAMGNLGDAKPVGQGVHELRIDYGPGYRVYFAKENDIVILLLLGGDKSTQSKDICEAVASWHDYKGRTTGK